MEHPVDCMFYLSRMHKCTTSITAAILCVIPLLLSFSHDSIAIENIIEDETDKAITIPYEPTWLEGPIEYFPAEYQEVVLFPVGEIQGLGTQQTTPTSDSSESDDSKVTGILDKFIEKVIEKEDEIETGVGKVGITAGIVDKFISTGKSTKEFFKRYKKFNIFQKKVYYDSSKSIGDFFGKTGLKKIFKHKRALGWLGKGLEVGLATDKVSEAYIEEGMSSAVAETVYQFVSITVSGVAEILGVGVSAVACSPSGPGALACGFGGGMFAGRTAEFVIDSIFLSKSEIPFIDRKSPGMDLKGKLQKGIKWVMDLFPETTGREPLLDDELSNMEEYSEPLTYPLSDEDAGTSDGQQLTSEPEDSSTTSSAAKIVTKQVVKKIGGVVSAGAVDLVWPSEIGTDKAIEDPSSDEYKAREEQIADQGNDNKCLEQYDPNIARDIEREYMEALDASDYARLKALRQKKEGMDLWRKQCSGTH